MIIIAHRGNLYGPDPRENSPSAIQTALNKGFYVEVDIRWQDGMPHLGHDKPQCTVPSHLYQDNELKGKIYWHAKDAAALAWAIGLQLNCFAHVNDPFVLTNYKEIWTCDPNLRSELKLPNKIILVSLNPVTFEGEKPYAICTDHPCRMKDHLDYNY